MAAAFAGAAAADQEKIRAYLDRAAPLHCEVVAVEARLARTQEGTAEYAKLSQELEVAKAGVRAYYQATWPEYMGLLMELPYEERQAVYAYSNSFEERCAAKRKAGTGSGAE